MNVAEHQWNKFSRVDPSFLFLSVDVYKIVLSSICFDSMVYFNKKMNAFPLKGKSTQHLDVESKNRHIWHKAVCLIFFLKVTSD